MLTKSQLFQDGARIQTQVGRLRAHSPVTTRVSHKVLSADHLHPSCIKHFINGIPKLQVSQPYYILQVDLAIWFYDAPWMMLMCKWSHNQDQQSSRWWWTTELIRFLGSFTLDAFEMRTSALKTSMHMWGGWSQGKEVGWNILSKRSQQTRDVKFQDRGDVSKGTIFLISYNKVFLFKIIVIIRDVQMSISSHFSFTKILTPRQCL